MSPQPPPFHRIGGGGGGAPAFLSPELVRRGQRQHRGERLDASGGFLFRSLDIAAGVAAGVAAAGSAEEGAEVDEEGVEVSEDTGPLHIEGGGKKEKKDEGQPGGAGGGDAASQRLTHRVTTDQAITED